MKNYLQLKVIIAKEDLDHHKQALHDIIYPLIITFKKYLLLFQLDYQ